MPYSVINIINFLSIHSSDNGLTKCLFPNMK